MPAWALYYAYAGEFGCHPQDVPRVVTKRAWERWLVLRKAQAAREAHQAWKSGGTSYREDPAARDLRLWAMQKGER